MKSSIVAAFLLGGLLHPASAQMLSPSAATSRPLFDNITSSTSIAFTTGAEVQLPPCQYSIPANTFLAAKDKIRWWAAGTNVASTDVKTIRARWGATIGTGNSGTTVGSTTSATASGANWVMTGYVSRVTTSAQRASTTGSVANSGNTAPSLTASPGASDAGAIVFVITGANANATPPADSVVCTEFHISVEGAAS